LQSLFLLNSSYFQGKNAVSDSLEDKIDRLEVLYSEQDYLIQSLNDMVAQQDQEISELNLSLDHIKNELRALKNDLAHDIDQLSEVPPHY